MSIVSLPTVSLGAMHARAVLYANLRDFFRVRQIVEVETAMDDTGDEQTAVFSAMQHLLEAGSGAIYQIGKVFRNEVLDRRHLAEFSVLHWCQPEWDITQALTDITAMFGAIFSGDIEPEQRTYRQAFIPRLGFDPADLSAVELRQQARRLGLNVSLGEDRQAWLDVIFTHFIEPTLGLEMPLFLLYEAAVDAQKRADVYIDGIKVGSVSTANRAVQSGSQYVSVSLGLDRLLMIMLETRQIAKTLSVSQV
ncbi:amino acid--tRNA ligase-related protein [Aquirhabdus parva]|uniref:Uncharacterized protein n=1 Tax=Aquirhabdus parva TaxID=2283318 RepID=A0A345P4A3_9GAMM|nr:amino acid--tRNA ligase-related protein [Aquirhabdus parva]AXI02112.1 hypothetical protein HYN46_04110 [Aquirhabdus parva]